MKSHTKILLFTILDILHITKKDTILINQILLKAYLKHKCKNKTISYTRGAR